MGFEGKRNIPQVRNEATSKESIKSLLLGAYFKGQFFRCKPYFMEAETHFFHILSLKYGIRTKITMGQWMEGCNLADIIFPS